MSTIPKLKPNRRNIYRYEDQKKAHWQDSHKMRNGRQASLSVGTQKSPQSFIKYIKIYNPVTIIC